MRGSTATARALTKALLAGALAASVADSATHPAETAEEQQGHEPALRVTFVGTGTPAPDTHRNAPAVLVEAGDHLLLFDAGDGTARAIGDLGIGVEKITAVFLTHLHSDHMGGLGDVLAASWNWGRTRALPVYGPPEVTDVLRGLEIAYRADTRYRSSGAVEDNDPAVAGGVAKAISVENGEPVVVHEMDGLVVKAVPTDHGHVEPAFGYRVDFRGRSVYLSGDSLASKELRQPLAGVDVMVFDTLDRKTLGDIARLLETAGNPARAERAKQVMSYHADAPDVGALAQAVDPLLLVLYHLIPSPMNEATERSVEDQVRTAFDGEVLAARDGTVLVLDAAGDASPAPPRIVDRGSLP